MDKRQDFRQGLYSVAEKALEKKMLITWKCVNVIYSF